MNDRDRTELRTFVTELSSFALAPAVMCFVVVGGYAGFNGLDWWWIAGLGSAAIMLTIGSIPAFARFEMALDERERWSDAPRPAEPPLARLARKVVEED